MAVKRTLPSTDRLCLETRRDESSIRNGHDSTRFLFEQLRTRHSAHARRSDEQRVRREYGLESRLHFTSPPSYTNGLGLDFESGRGRFNCIAARKIWVLGLGNNHDITAIEYSRLDGLYRREPLEQPGRVRGHHHDLRPGFRLCRCKNSIQICDIEESGC
jgi:hypothetical protein